MAHARLFVALAAMLGLLVCSACRSRTSLQREPSVALLEKMQILDTGQEKVRIGLPERFENLALFPVFSSAQKDIGPVLSLQAALARGAAEVRELGAGRSEGAASNPARAHLLNAELGTGPSVGKLAIENEGTLPVYVLAGTIVKGGNQDRQIGQDFVVAPKTTVAVDAFCIEHGRWTGEREGAATHGKFETLEQLATSKVRVAGQYESNQGGVWSEVAKVNAANGKEAPSGTLLASLDDAELARLRQALARRVSDGLSKLEPKSALVGFGYAINGTVKGVRWFSSHALFETFRDVLVNTAAADAVNARGASDRQPVPPASAIVHFVKDVEQAAPEERATSAQNVNHYKRAKSGYGTATKLAASPNEAPMAVSRDYATK